MPACSRVPCLVSGFLCPRIKNCSRDIGQGNGIKAVYKKESQEWIWARVLGNTCVKASPGP